MAVTLTLKNIPEDVYRRLKLSAEANRRSLNSEAIVCLESVLAPNRLPAGERLKRARKFREQLGDTKFKAGDIDKVKRQGRP
jgi:plasmid stability protein